MRFLDTFSQGAQSLKSSDLLPVRTVNFYFVLFLDGTLESQARRRKKTTRRTVKIGDGGTETADGKHDESKHGRIAKRKTKCCDSEQNAARDSGGNAEVAKPKK